MKITKNLTFLAVFIALWFAAGVSFAANFTFDVSLVSRTLDAARSAGDILGFDNWYVWKYRVDVIEGDQKHALSNWVLQLPNCYITSEDLFREIETSTGAGGGDQLRIYNQENVHPDPNLGIAGLKWNFDGGDALDATGEYDYFWFSAPTDLSIEGDWGAKSGGNEKYGNVEVPDCPGCDPGVPEPVSSALFSMGLAGMGLVRRKKLTRYIRGKK
ncbi:MAG: PEP-CTERM sorting domain-containing protein [Candidatus Omnitrophota bacterium]